jgi:hypothetical protein
MSEKLLIFDYNNNNINEKVNFQNLLYSADKENYARSKFNGKTDDAVHTKSQSQRQSFVEKSYKTPSTTPSKLSEIPNNFVNFIY